MTTSPHPALAALRAQAAAWSRGDLDGYLARVHPDVVYVRADALVCGRDALAAAYRRSYGDPAGMGHLTVEVLDAVLSSAQAALVIRWALDGRGGRALVVFVPPPPAAEEGGDGGWLLRQDATLAEAPQR